MRRLEERLAVVRLVVVRRRDAVLRRDVVLLRELVFAVVALFLLLAIISSKNKGKEFESNLNLIKFKGLSLFLPLTFNIQKKIFIAKFF